MLTNYETHIWRIHYNEYLIAEQQSTYFDSP